MDAGVYLVVLVVAVIVILVGVFRYTLIGKRLLGILFVKVRTQSDILSDARQVFVENSALGVLVLDHERRIIQVNPRAESFTSTPAPELLFRPIESVFPGLRLSERDGTAVFQQRLNGLDLSLTVSAVYARNGAARPSGWLVSILAPSPAVESVTGPLTGLYGKETNSGRMAAGVSERKILGPDLCDSEGRFRRLVDSVPVMIWIANVEAKFTYLNRAWLEFTGRSMQDDLGDGWQECVPAGDKQSLLGLFAVAEQGGSGFSAEFRLRRADGEFRWIYCSVSPFLDEEGIFLGFIGSGLDISEQKEREHQLRTFSMAVEQNPASIMLTDPEGRIVYVNRKFVQVSGYSRLEVIGQNPWVLKSGETSSDEYGNLWNTVLAGGEWHGFFHNRKKNGELFWESVSVSGIANAKGEIVYLLGIKEDITEQKQAEISLQESRASLEAIFNNPQLGIALVDTSGKYRQVNERFARMLGYTPEEMLHLSNLSVTHLEDVAETRRLVLAVFNKEIPEFYLEKRYVRKDGVIFWGSLSCTPIYQPDGSVRELVGFIYDISERKAIAEKLRESEELYRSIIHASPDGIMITNLDGVIQMVSPSAVKQWGYESEKDMIGAGMEKLIGVNDRSQVSALIALMNFGLGPQVLEAKGLRLDGSWFFFEAAMELMDADQEKFKRVVYITRDVSERKRMEAQERQRVSELEALRATMNDLSGELELPTLLNVIVDRLLVLLGAKVGGLALYNETDMVMTHVVSKGFLRDYTGVNMQLGEGLMGQVGKVLKTVIVDNYATWENRSPVFEESPFSMVGVPLMAGEKLLGGLMVGIDSKIRQFAEQDAHLIELFAQQASIAIQNAKLFSEVRRLATLDPLTGLYNRRFFFERAQKELRRSVRYNSPMTLVMLDIDHFKSINDQFGHPCGDEVLRRLASACRSSTRDFDVIGRYGGEEFILLLPETGLAGALATAERIRMDVECMVIESEHGKIAITISAGISNLGTDNANLESMLSEADKAMYRAKQGGRNRIEVFKAE